MFSSVTPPETSVRMGLGASRRATPMAPYGLRIHVVEEDSVGPGPCGLGHLMERIAFDLDQPTRPKIRARPTASVIPIPAKWLSLTNTASDRPAR